MNRRGDASSKEARSSFESKDFRKLHVTPPLVYAVNWVYTGNPPKAQELLEVGGLKKKKKKQYTDHLIGSPATLVQFLG